jgi:hypothetical protein
MKIRTHYDNLKVARNAPPEVIRAAYKILSQKYHPDRNPGSVEATRIMAIINAAYDTLSDPYKRKEHDQWIAQQEMMAEQAESRHAAGVTPMAQSAQTVPPSHGSGRTILAHIFRYPIFYGLLILALVGWATDTPDIPPRSPKPYSWAATKPDGPVSADPGPVPVQSEYVRPVTAPNGQPWPTGPGYVKGFPLLNADGLSVLTVDNRQNDSDVFVKLVSVAGPMAHPVRQFYIPAGGSFTLNKIRAGNYDIRYRDLNSGGLSRSQAFDLEEIVTDSGKRFSRVTMTLYKVHDGNMQTYALSEAEF